MEKMKVLTQNLTGCRSTSASPVSSAYSSILAFGCPSQLLSVCCAQLHGLSRTIKLADASDCSIRIQDPNWIVPLLSTGSFFCLLLLAGSPYTLLQSQEGWCVGFCTSVWGKRESVCVSVSERACLFRLSTTAVWLQNSHCQQTDR